MQRAKRHHDQARRLAHFGSLLEQRLDEHVVQAARERLDGALAARIGGTHPGTELVEELVHQRTDVGGVGDAADRGDLAALGDERHEFLACDEVGDHRVAGLEAREHGVCVERLGKEAGDAAGVLVARDQALHLGLGRAKLVEQGGAHARAHAAALARLAGAAGDARMQGREARAHAHDVVAKLRRCARARSGTVDRSQDRVEQHAAARALHGQEGVGQALRIATRQEVEREVLVHAQARRGEGRAQAIGGERAAKLLRKSDGVRKCGDRAVEAALGALGVGLDQRSVDLDRAHAKRRCARAGGARCREGAVRVAEREVGTRDAHHGARAVERARVAHRAGGEFGRFCSVSFTERQFAGDERGRARTARIADLLRQRQRARGGGLRLRSAFGGRKRAGLHKEATRHLGLESLARSGRERRLDGLKRLSMRSKHSQRLGLLEQESGMMSGRDARDHLRGALELAQRIAEATLTGQQIGAVADDHGVRKRKGREQLLRALERSVRIGKPVDLEQRLAHRVLDGAARGALGFGNAGKRALEAADRVGVLSAHLVGVREVELGARSKIHATRRDQCVARDAPALDRLAGAAQLRQRVHRGHACAGLLDRILRLVGGGLRVGGACERLVEPAEIGKGGNGRAQRTGHGARRLRGARGVRQRLACAQRALGRSCRDALALVAERGDRSGRAARVARNGIEARRIGERLEGCQVECRARRAHAEPPRSPSGSTMVGCTVPSAERALTTTS